ncbi:MAG: hypothetical protein JSU70_23495 [Phycisphaerales bacterium]|nr:MAG: hypothetical protein JSU70_23495 [Phycisphaerales bacterium]
MRARQSVFVILAVFLVVTTILGSATVVDTREIDSVRGKQVLDSQDFAVIDSFVAEAVQRLVRSRDFTSIAQIRTLILSRRSNQAQYAKQFSQSAQKHISEGFEQAKTLSEDRPFKVTLNLLILIDGMQDPLLVDLAIGKLGEANQVLRYWAVRGVTSPVLGAGGTPDAQLVQRVATALKGLIDSSGPEILALVAQFAAKTNDASLLGQIADTRIKRYADWTVKREHLDTTILKLLCDRITAASPGTQATARRFAQLYSYAIQRYVKGENLLSSSSRLQLASVMAETEDKCVSELLGRPQADIRRAVERSDYSALLQEHDGLLGGGAGPGELVSRLRFDYGRNQDGSVRTAPLALPEPPKPKP